MNDEAAGGRIFFSSVRRSLEEEDEIRLLSVGIDIGRCRDKDFENPTSVSPDDVGLARRLAGA